jgi:hypothetical protein
MDVLIGFEFKVAVRAEVCNGSWPCKNSLKGRRSWKPRRGLSQAAIAAISVDPDDVHDPCQIIGQDRKCHFSGYFWKRFSEEIHHAELMFRREGGSSRRSCLSGTVSATIAFIIPSSSVSGLRVSAS